jgi:uncharacterized Zn finger protein
METGTKIYACNCVQPYQDAKYGKGKRVHNVSQSKGNSHKIRCATCGNVVDLSFKKK